MAFVLTDALLLVDGTNLSGQSNTFSMGADIPDEDVTTFNSGGWKEVTAGIGSHTWKVGGFWAAGDLTKPDDRSWAEYLGPVAAWTAAAPSAEGSTAYLGKVLATSHQFGGDVGNVAPFEINGSGSGRPVRGTLLHPAGTARTSSGTGNAYQLGALSASQVMTAALHVCSVSGTTPSLTVKLRSSATSGGTYADRITFTAANAIGSQLLTVAGAVTDTWWRIEWTISGTSPSFLMTVAAGI